MEKRRGRSHEFDPLSPKTNKLKFADGKKSSMIFSYIHI